eukprot:351801-Chlamydomonas_euryale.AAC.24
MHPEVQCKGLLVAKIDHVEGGVAEQWQSLVEQGWAADPQGTAASGQVAGRLPSVWCAESGRELREVTEPLLAVRRTQQKDGQHKCCATDNALRPAHLLK